MLEARNYLAARERPAGLPVMHQRWERLLFLHWAWDPGQVASLLPPGLELDLFEGRAWVAATPFTLTGLRPLALPSLPAVSRFHELNARTYVHRHGVPGVWFFSLDAASRLAVFAARRLYKLPYFHARIEVAQRGGSVHYAAQRAHAGAHPARFEATWTPGARIPQSEPGSLPFFLTERYVLFAADGRGLHRARIHHPPWTLHTAEVGALRSTLLEAAGLATPVTAPLAHHSAVVQVSVWPLQRA
jgi:uncharacterized protein YqjF (DUF2071 family)